MLVREVGGVERTEECSLPFLPIFVNIKTATWAVFPLDFIWAWGSLRSIVEPVFVPL